VPPRPTSGRRRRRQRPRRRRFRRRSAAFQRDEAFHVGDVDGRGGNLRFHAGGAGFASAERGAPTMGGGRGQPLVAESSVTAPARNVRRIGVLPVTARLLRLVEKRGDFRHVAVGDVAAHVCRLEQTAGLGNGRG
jgi:hypothetical protein